MNNVHSTFIPILNSIFPLANPRKKSIKERLVAHYESLKMDRELVHNRVTGEMVMDMARIKTILRERYNYTVTY